MDTFLLSGIMEKLNIQQTNINKLLTRKTPTQNLITDGAVSGNVLTFDGYNWVPCAKDLLFFFKNKFVYKNADIICINEG